MTLGLRDDQIWEQLLRKLEVPNYPRTYVLGSLAKHVTFHSQQMRALNLIHALCCTGRLDAGSHVGIVGGGLAGLTAAAGALRRGLRASIFEAKGSLDEPDGLMPLQRASTERWVDPDIYDWPDERATTLPLLGWTAEHADTIRTAILKEIASDPRPRIRKALIEEGHLSWTASGVRIQPPGGEPVDVDVLILAVGFGTEDEVHTQSRYWTNDGLDGDQIEGEGKAYLVSGSGDGGLTDLMRLCIKGFRHRAVVQGMRDSAAATQAGLRLQQVEREIAGDTEPEREARLVKEYVSEAVALRLPFLRRRTEVYLVSRLGALFAGKASVLNRLIVAALWQQRAFSLIPYRIVTPVTDKVRYKDDEGRTAKDVSAYDYDGQAVTGMVVKGSVPPRFARLIIRHGPGRFRPDGDAIAGRKGPLREGPLEVHFPNLYKACGERAGEWEATHHWNDITRRSQFENEFTVPPGLDPRFGPHGCVVVERRPPKADRDPPLYFAAVGAMRALGWKDEGLISLFPDVEVKSPRALVRAVRALCRAPIAIFDVSRPSEQLLTMFLLGIRAVARRGVTILTRAVRTKARLDPGEVAFLLRDDMPFNLKDVTIYGRSEGIEQTLSKAIESGYRRMLALGPNYQDLPVYDAVRFRPVDELDVLPVGPREQNLMLTRFHDGYRRRHGRELRELLRRFYLTDPSKRSPDLVWINQTPSPELTTAKLYAAIRRHTLCIVDWTDGSPNVFFELGVRLAVNAKPPVCVTHADEPQTASWRRQLAALDRLLTPIRYRGGRGDDELRFQESFQGRLIAVEGDSTSTAWPSDAGAISADLVYRTVRDALAPEDEWFGRAAHDDLARTASQLLETEASPALRILYGDRAAMHDTAREAALERWLAVWHYLDARYRMRARLRAGEIAIAHLSQEDSAWFEATDRLNALLKTATHADATRLSRRVAWAASRIDAMRDAAAGV